MSYDTLCETVELIVQWPDLEKALAFDGDQLVRIDGEEAMPIRVRDAALMWVEAEMADYEMQGGSGATWSEVAAAGSSGWWRRHLSTSQE